MSRVEPHAPRRLGRSLFIMGTLGLAVHLLLPQLSGLRATGVAIAQASWWLAPTVVVLEAFSLFAYGHMLHLLIVNGGQTVPEGVVQRATVMGYAVGRAMPGGSGAAFALVLSSFGARGLDPVITGTAMWGTGLLSSAVLALLLPIAVVIGLFSGRMGGIGVSAVVAAVGLVMLAALVPLGLRNPEGLAARVRRIATFVARGPLRRRINPEALADGAARGARSIAALMSDRKMMRRVVAWAAANWLVDAAVVAVLALTVGRETPLTAVLLAYIIAHRCRRATHPRRGWRRGDGHGRRIRRLRRTRRRRNRDRARLAVDQPLAAHTRGAPHDARRHASSPRHRPRHLTALSGSVSWPSGTHPTL